MPSRGCITNWYYSQQNKYTTMHAPNFAKALLENAITEDEKIIEYSQPNKGIPIGHGCYRNSIGASGPMQFLPYVWTSYASSVNRFGGYTHTPYIANIRDSVYGAAWKLKRDSRTTDINWTYDQVRRAIICYNAGCGRLNNPPSSTLRYLKAVWAIYKS